MNTSGDPTYTLVCDKCHGAYISQEAFPKPQLCPKCCLLLTDERERIIAEIEKCGLKLNRGGILSDVEVAYYNRGAEAQAQAIIKLLEEK